MIIYNTTFYVPKSLKDKFIDFVKYEYLQEALKDNLVNSPRLARIYSEDEEEESYSYALELHAQSLDDLEKWNYNRGNILQKLILERFQQQILGFATVLLPETL